jgi:uncharacterized protein GlcG (DUF336 family)
MHSAVSIRREFFLRTMCPPGTRPMFAGAKVRKGGLPILTADGAHIGGIGVSGATGDQDEANAPAALDAIASMLE